MRSKKIISKKVDKAEPKEFLDSREKTRLIFQDRNTNMAARKLKKTTVLITLGKGVTRSSIVRPELKELSATHLRKPAPLSRLSAQSGYVKLLVSSISKNNLMLERHHHS